MLTRVAEIMDNYLQVSRKYLEVFFRHTALSFTAKRQTSMDYQCLTLEAIHFSKGLIL